MRILWRKAWKIWDDAEVVDHIKPGDYSVRVSLFPRWRDEKHVADERECYNISGIGRFGYFHIVKSHIEKCLILCYNTPRNGVFASRIVDHVRHIRNTNCCYVGWFGIRVGWLWIRLSPFTMTKVK